MLLTFTTLRSLAVTTIGESCRFFNLYWFKNTNQCWMQTSRRCLYAFLTCCRASCLIHDVTRHHYRRVFSWVMWPRMLHATTSLPKQPFAFFIFDSVFLLNDQKEPAAWSLQFNLQCNDDDNKSHRNVCNMSFVSFSFFDFHYKTIQHFRLSCTHRFVINNQNWRFRSRAW